jgi:hypothetical protein
MNMTEVKTLAKARDVKCGKMNKAELIRTMQRQEGNAECFNTGQANSCGQGRCLWLADCR